MDKKYTIKPEWINVVKYFMHWMEAHEELHHYYNTDNKESMDKFIDVTGRWIEYWNELGVVDNAMASEHTHNSNIDNRCTRCDVEETLELVRRLFRKDTILDFLNEIQEEQ